MGTLLQRTLLTTLALASPRAEPASRPSYPIEFENEYVRVSRAKYLPGDRLPAQAHPSVPTVYVYLTDGGPIRFKHASPAFVAERAAVKAGSVRFNRNARFETHDVLYLGETPSEYLRVELHTVPGPPHPDARLRTDKDFPWEDPQPRITRFRGPAPKIASPALLVDLVTARYSWLPAGTRAGTSWYLLIELKSAPLPPALADPGSQNGIDRNRRGP